MAILQFRLGSWIVDKDKVKNFIERLEICIHDETCENNDDARSLLESVKTRNAYNNKQLGMLEALEYEVERNSASNRYGLFYLEYPEDFDNTDLPF